MKKNILFLSALLFLLGQCKTPLSLSKTQTQNIKINKDSLQLYDAKIFNTIAPYKIKLDSLMNAVLCYNNQDLKKDLPEGTLGNFVCDELMDFAKMNYSKSIDFCMYNNGGLRVGSIAKGNITVGKIYELAPFDNAIVVVELGGNDCKRLFDLIAQNNGTPCSKEFRMTIENNLATNIFIKNEPFDSTKTYRILTNDYVASGGDKTEPMKKAIAVTSLNLMVRDALIKQLRTRGNNSQPINTILDGRIK